MKMIYELTRPAQGCLELDGTKGENELAVLLNLKGSRVEYLNKCLVLDLNFI